MKLSSITGTSPIQESFTPARSMHRLPNRIDSISPKPIFSLFSKFLSNCENTFLFFLNLIAFPAVLQHLQFFMIFQIIFLPFLIVAETINKIIDCLTCRCLKKDNLFTPPRYTVPSMTHNSRVACERLLHSANKMPFVRRPGKGMEAKEIELIHIIRNFFRFIDNLPAHHFSVSSANIGGQTYLFRQPVATARKPKHLCERDEIAGFLEFFRKHYRKGNQISFSFAKIQRGYWFGLLDLRIGQTTVVCPLQGSADLRQKSCFQRLFFRKNKLRESSSDFAISNYSMWPGHTKEKIATAINRGIRCHGIEGHQVCLTSLDKIVSLD